MVHSCVVPECKNRSNKSECNGIKFYTLPTSRKMLEKWLLLIGRKISEVTVHSRICSKHFVDGKKTKGAILQIFPWQKRPSTVAHQSTHLYAPTLTTSRLSPAAIVYHDHSYCMPLSHLPTHLTPNSQLIRELVHRQLYGHHDS